MAKYDVFISYRRRDLVLAQAIKQLLAAKRYRVFLDKEGIGNGPFPDTLEGAIRSSRNMVVIVNNESIQRSIQVSNAAKDSSDELPHDWLAEEVSIALHNRRNIIPIAPLGFEFPSKLPRFISRLAAHNCIFFNDNDMFDAAFTKKLTKRVICLRKILLPAAAVLAALACLVFFLLKPPGETDKPGPDSTTIAETTAAPETTALPALDYVFYVYQDYQSPENHYHDIAYMGSDNNGDDGSIAINPGSAAGPQSGETCMEIRYTPQSPAHWAGAMWLSGYQNLPPNPPVEGADTARTQRLAFWAKGAGRVKFFIENDSKNQVTQYIDLTGDWSEYTLALPEEWGTVCVGFGWSANSGDAGGGPMTFWLDGIRFEG